MDLLLHFKVNEGDENNINIQEYYQESFENIYYGNSYEEEIWMDEYEKDAKTQEIESNELEF